MASIEFLQKRIAGKEKEIAKIEKKIERILKAKASNWENNPYYYDENDLKWANKDLENAKASLETYREELAEATAKAESRDVKVILEFLEGWKAQSRKFYIDSVEHYLEARAEFYRIDKELCNTLNSTRDREERNRIRTQMRNAQANFRNEWGWIEPYIEFKAINLEKLDKDLKAEAERKYDFIIERTVAITGTITDASNLYIGKDGYELNGFIIGENGKAKVQTIGAGGWNIQRFHFRTLVHRF